MSCLYQFGSYYWIGSQITSTPAHLMHGHVSHAIHRGLKLGTVIGIAATFRNLTRPILSPRRLRMDRPHN